MNQIGCGGEKNHHLMWWLEFQRNLGQDLCRILQRTASSVAREPQDFVYILNLPFHSSCDSWWEASDFLKAKPQTFRAQLKHGVGLGANPPKYLWS